MRILVITILLLSVVNSVFAAKAAEPPTIIDIQTVARTSTVEGEHAAVLRTLTASGTVQTIIMNSSATVQPVLAKFHELQDEKYDVYVSGNLVGAKTRQELEAGLQVDAPGCTLLNSRKVIQLIQKESEKWMKQDGPPNAGAGTSRAVLANVQSWSRNADGRIRNSGSVAIILSPVGKALPLMPSWTTPSPDEVKDATAKYWQAIAFERAVINKRVKDYILRNGALSAITPVDVSLSIDKTGKVKLKVTNFCQSPISGKITLLKDQEVIPGKSATFSNLARDGVHDTSLGALELPADALKKLSARADIKIGTIAFTKTVSVAGD